MNEQENGYSSMFYIMLIVGIIGVVGFVRWQPEPATKRGQAIRETTGR